MKLLRKIPFFLFLLPVFFVLHGWLENQGFLQPGELPALAGMIGFGLLLVFALFYLLLKKNTVLAALTVFFIGIWYLFFGAIVDWLKTFDGNIFLASYSWLIPILLLLTVVWVIVLKRNKRLQQQFFFFFNFLLIIYCCVDAFMLFQNRDKGKVKAAQQLSFEPGMAKAKPNVYFLLFDEYAGKKSLADSFNFRNDGLDSMLVGKGFTMLPVFSNYDFTLFSMSAILNMQYVQNDYEPFGIVQRDLQLRTNEIRNSLVPGIFKSMGYQFNNYSVFDIADQKGIARRNSFLPMQSALLTDKILHNRFMRTSGWLFQTGKFAIPSLRKKYLYEHDNNNLRVERAVMELAAMKKSTPQFCYAHFMLPHWPFYKDSTGKYHPDQVVATETNMNDKALYVSYLKYSNTVIRRLVHTIVEQDPSAIVLVMSDHGFRSFTTRGSEPLVFDNIAALRLPGNQTPMPKTIPWSNVNIFRYLFNVGFGQHFSYLPDSSIILKYK